MFVRAKRTVTRTDISTQANKAKAQELQALRDEHAAALAKEKKRADGAEKEIKSNDTKLKEAEKRAQEQATEHTIELENARQKVDEIQAKSADVSCPLSTQSEMTKSMIDLMRDRRRRRSPRQRRPRSQPSPSLTIFCSSSGSWRTRSRSIR